MGLVHVVQRNCSDYYCGCGGGHIVGIFTDPAVAQGEASVPYTTMSVTSVELDEPRWNSESWRELDAKDGWT